MNTRLPKTVWFTVENVEYHTYPVLSPVNTDIFRRADLQESPIWFFEDGFNIVSLFHSNGFEWLFSWGCETIAIKRDGYIQFYNVENMDEGTTKKMLGM